MSTATVKRPSPLVRLHRDVSALLDASDEAENNVQRKEADFLRTNLRHCSTLARRIERQVKGKRLGKLVSKLEGGRR